MTTIISKSGTGIPASDKLETAELAVDTSNGDLYTKLEDGSIVKLNDGSGDGGGEDGRITDTQISNWDEAYGWGDHSTEGYLTEFTESDPTVPQYVKDITQDDIDRWNAGGGGSGGAGILMSDTEPSSKEEGMMWMDTSTSPAVVWIWDGAAWVEFPFVGSSPKLAAPIPKIEYLVIAGGGAGVSGATAGGGGAGGYRTNVPGDRSGGDTDPETTPAEFLNVPLWTQFIVKVGEGGFTRTGAGTDSTNSEKKGQNSSFGPVVAMGGGRGGSGNGGSGGGANGLNTGSASGGNPQPGQGFKGGDAQVNTVNGGGGSGGGGAGTTEVANGNARDGNHGGDGLVSSIDGLNKARAAGGGGASSTSRTPGNGGNGGGGNGGMGSASNPAILPTAGEPNTGGGGGAGNSTSADYDHTRNSGGSGVVIVRYQGPQWATGGVVTTHNGYTVHTFTSGEAIFNVTGPVP